MENEELTENEELMENEFRDNYMKCITTLIAMNINTVYKYYKNNSDVSLKNIVNASRDDYLLNQEDKLNVSENVKVILSSEYGLEVLSSYDEYLKFRKV